MASPSGDNAPDRTEQRALETVWRQRVREARLRYEVAAKGFRATWGAHYEKHLAADPTFAIQQARKVETQALEEYVRVLKIFTDLVISGKIPDQDAP